jgi:putative heme-binding domain-containing protein
VSIDEPALTDLDGWVKRLEGPGNADEGERIFFHPKGPGCYRCHEIDGRGGRIGPELSATGRSLDRRRLIESIIAPSKEVAPAFVPWLISRTDGTTVTGLLIGETIDGKQTYAESTGKIFSISPTEVAERRPQPTSIMPDNFPRQMTTQEFRDLLAFLQKR